MIPTNVDILITHGPALNILDFADYSSHSGSDRLLAAIKRAKPKVHLFGHIHEAFGVSQTEELGLLSVNSAQVDWRTTKVCNKANVIRATLQLDGSMGFEVVHE